MGKLRKGRIMEKSEVLQKVIEIITPFAKNQSALDNISMETKILEDLKVNSARLVDIILKVEDTFDIEVDDDEADKARTIGDTVNIILAKKP